MPHDRFSIDTNVVEFVRLGQMISRNFIAPIGNRATFEEVMAISAFGKTFDPIRVAATIGPVFGDAMRVHFGRIGWIILDLDVPSFQHQRIEHAGTAHSAMYGTGERQDFTQRVIDWGVEVGTYEATVRQNPFTKRESVNEPGENPSRIRLFWE
ncbi:MAG TPA: hypothetical protein VGL46_12630 [Pseudonocardiaceae bacterium]|jgi:hypothetical protein